MFLDDFHIKSLVTWASTKIFLVIFRSLKQAKYFYNIKMLLFVVKTFGVLCVCQIGHNTFHGNIKYSAILAKSNTG